MNSQEHKGNSIRFIDSGYNEKFRVNDGDKILIHTRNGTTLERECKYIDDYHVVQQIRSSNAMQFIWS